MESPLTVSDAAAAFLADMENRTNLEGRRRRATSTLRAYRSHLTRWLDVPFYRDGQLVTLGELPIADVDTATLRSLLAVVMDTPSRNGRPRAPYSVRNVQSSFGALFAWSEIRYGLRNFAQPTRGLDLGRRVLDTAIRAVKEPTYLDGDDADRIAAAAGPIYQPLIEFINSTGARSGEARGVRWCDLHLDGLVPFVRFTVQADHLGHLAPSLKHRAIGEYREVPLPAEQAAKLRQRAEQIRAKGGDLGERLVFPTVHGGPRTGPNLLKAVVLMAERVGIENVTPHTLRDAYARRLLNNGVDIKTLSETLGHKDVSTTVNAYLDASVPIEKRAEAINQAFHSVDESDAETDAA
jgi:integrase